MPVSLQRLPEEPIILMTVSDPFDVHEDIFLLLEQAAEILRATRGPLYVVTDARNLTLSFSDQVAGLALLTKDDQRILHHPSIAGFWTITRDTGIWTSVKALQQVQYGNIRVSLHRTPDEALSAVRQEISRHSQATLTDSSIAIR